ncbi:MAG: hypothetical protein HND39_01420 [Ignavibacteriota bacterium]|nr:hypothetical protein [Ignavibacteriales bacterium]MBL1122751.1 hypothetical protein [Ignavibacteriota bacterium]MCE7856765.1 hypothetical protein [Ignavibacteria bacterium CHB3]MCZ7612107.1 hypothetical protein [Ignavibacteriaceae bacterium]QKJ95029.1 MAG: hypothetical protein HND39_01420 [Ignavibacteriota bacterium]
MRFQISDFGFRISDLRTKIYLFDLAVLFVDTNIAVSSSASFNKDSILVLGNNPLSIISSNQNADSSTSS